MAVVIPPRNEVFTAEGLPTLRFYEFLRSLSDQSNVTTSDVTSMLDNTAISLLNDLINRIGSGDFLTWDDTGFTWDSDKLSFDMDEA